MGRKLEAIIQAQFNRGPGHTKVRSREYELFYGVKGPSGPPLDASKFLPVPGMVITTTFSVGQYADSQCCPRYGCDSPLSLANADTVGRIW